ncbi:MAG: amidohydrolase family protein [Burkholderiales bacterium]
MIRSLAAGLVTTLAMSVAQGAELPVFDAHVHYSHDAVEMLPVEMVIELLRKANVKRALVSSSDDDGTQKLYAAAPDLIVPELRPYRRRGEIATWVRDPAVITYLEERLRKYRYVAIGEFHLYGADADLPVPRRMVQLARQYGLMLHAHSDADTIERLFAQWPQARILWAHSGFERPERVREMLARHPNLWADLAFRTDHGAGGKIPPEWRAAFLEFPDRFMVGTDTYVPERWHYVPEHATWSRAWLAELPPEVAEQIAWKNGAAVIGEAFDKKRSD